MIYTISNVEPSIEWELEEEKRIVQNVLNIIRTRIDEVPFMRDLGIDTDYTDNTIEILEVQLKDDIITAIEKYEPRAEVKEVRLLDIIGDGSLIYEIEIEV